MWFILPAHCMYMVQEANTCAVDPPENKKYSKYANTLDIVCITCGACANIPELGVVTFMQCGDTLSLQAIMELNGRNEKSGGPYVWRFGWIAEWWRFKITAIMAQVGTINPKMDGYAHYFKS